MASLPPTTLPNPPVPIPRPSGRTTNPAAPISRQGRGTPRRSSSRSIKRKKFDDELVESSLKKASKQRVEITGLEKEVKRPMPTGKGPKKQRKSKNPQVNKDFGRWRPADDLALITAIQQTNDLTAVYLGVKFSCRFSQKEIQERWYQLLYDPVVSRLKTFKDSFNPKHAYFKNQVCLLQTGIRCQLQCQPSVGNEIEWKYPTSVNLIGVEFKALASGSHTITKDFIYFKTKDGLYGLSCFERIAVDNVAERGARMKSVGILCAKYTSLHEHMPFLEEEVRRQLENPGHYDDLENYYHSYKNCVLRNNYIPSPTDEKLPGLDEIPVLKITHPAGCFTQFIKFFGEQIFVLWKFVLLQKRILFFSPPPVGVACYRVYCACLLASHGIPFGFETGSNPLFFTNVCDLSALKEEHKYVACTTEKIFESKLEVYDVYVDNQNIKCKQHLSWIAHFNNADRDRLHQLDSFRQEQLYTGGDVCDDEKMYTKFFVNLNNKLFQTLFEVASTEDRTLTPEHIRSIGLDSKADLHFLSDLVDLYGIDVHIPEPKCCPFYV